MDRDSRNAIANGCLFCLAIAIPIVFTCQTWENPEVTVILPLLQQRLWMSLFHPCERLESPRCSGFREPESRRWLIVWRGKDLIPKRRKGHVGRTSVTNELSILDPSSVILFNSCHLLSFSVKLLSNFFFLQVLSFFLFEFSSNFLYNSLSFPSMSFYVCCSFISFFVFLHLSGIYNLRCRKMNNVNRGSILSFFKFYTSVLT